MRLQKPYFNQPKRYLISLRQDFHVEKCVLFFGVAVLNKSPVGWLHFVIPPADQPDICRCSRHRQSPAFLELLICLVFLHCVKLPDFVLVL